jgi:carbon-monoxide dehydrogenase large subunit
MDVAGAELGIDPLEVRRRNLVREFPHQSPTGLVYDEGSYVEAMEVAIEAIDVADFRGRQVALREQGRYLGLGFSVFSERTGYGTLAFAARSMDITPGYETVALSMDPSGFVEAQIGASPHGQGLATSLSQLIADELGVMPGSVRITHSDTDRTPYGWGTFASRSMVISGGAALEASHQLRDKIARIAGDELEAAAEDIVLENGRATVRGTDVGLDISEIARLAYHQSHRLAEGLEPGLSTRATYDPPGTFSNAVHVAEVEVDTETGHVRIIRFLVVEDAGKLINPMIVDGQIHGGVAQGIANALLEEIVYDSSGNPLTTSMMDYLPPTAAEIPDIEIIHLETVSDFTATGAKGVGEGGAIGAPAAVLNAISDALRPFQVEVFEMPATPQRIRALLRERITA